MASFYVERREEFPKVEPASYFSMLAMLDRSCERLGFRHVVLTDELTVGRPEWPADVEPWVGDNVPLPLMQACTHLQAQYLEGGPDTDTLFVGADSILLADPRPHLPVDVDLCVTSRRAAPKFDAINNGFMFVSRRSAAKAAALYRRVADRCGTEWRDDQRALVAELAPVPLPPVIEERAGLRVAFLPMRQFNDCPRWAGDPCNGAVLLHFRGAHRKELMPAWMKRQGLT